MSVWAEACYKTDALFDLLPMLSPSALHHPSVNKFCNLNYKWNPTVADQLHEGPLVESLQRDPMMLHRVAPAAFSRMKFNIDPFLDYLAEGEVHYGITAVYKIIYAAEMNLVRWNNELDWVWLEKYVGRMLRCNQYASYQSPPAATDQIKAWFVESEWKTRMKKYENMAQTFKHLQFVFNEPSHKKAEKDAEATKTLPPELNKRILWLGKGWHLRRLGRLTLLTNDYLGKLHHYVLTKKDLRRLSQMCSSIADMELYFSNYGDPVASKRVYQGYRDVLAVIIKAMRSPERPNELARACDVASALLLSYYADDIWDQSIKDQKAKIWKEDLLPVLDVIHLTSLLRKFPLAESIELSKVYKFLPCPDFDFTTFFHKQREKHEATRPAFYANDLGLTIDDFKLYQKHQMLLMYYRRHGSCFGSIKRGVAERPWHQHYPDVPPSNIPYKEVGDIQYSTTFQYNQVEGHYNPYVKDKALAPDTLSNVRSMEELHKLPLTQRSYMMSYLENPNPPTPVEVATMGAKYERLHTVFPKPESKKENARNVYVNNYAGRVFVSELDNNIAAYLEHKPGNFIGIGNTQSFNKFVEMGGTELEKAENTYVYVSFDLAGFSPQQSPKLRQIQLEKWAEAFGRPYLLEIDKQFSDSSVHYIYHGIHQQYELRGNDLEGYLGRLNTDLHIDVMAYATRKLRELGYIDTGVKLACMIDDGLCAIKFPMNTSNETIAAAIRIIEQIYAWFSLEISWDKTYVSKRLRVFLNEIEYDTIRVTPGVKAFLRIRSERVEGIRCPIREANKAASMVSGALEAGATPLTAWFKYAVELAKFYLDWGRHHKQKLGPDEAALWSFIPVAFGGLGAMSMLQHASNCTDNSTATGISILRAIAFHDTATAPTINAFLNQPIATKNPLAVVRDPMAFTIEGPTLSDTLEIPLAKRALRLRVRNPIVREALQHSVDSDKWELWTTMPNPEDTRGKALELIYSSSPAAIVDHIIMQFSRSSSVVSLLGSRVSLSLYKRYRAQFRRNIINTLSITRGMPTLK